MGLISDYLPPKSRLWSDPQAADHRARSRYRARAAWDDTTAGQVIENFANLSSWSSGTATQVSGNRCYGNGQGAGSGMNRSFAIGAAETLRAVFNVNVVGSPGSGGCIVGVSSDSAGGSATSGGGAARGIYFSSAGISRWDNGTSTLLNATTSTKSWLVTVTADETYISVVARATDDSAEYVVDVFARSGFTINNLFVFNSDSRGLSGNSVGLIGARKGIATIAPRAGVEGVAQTGQYVSLPDGNRCRIILPKNYDSRVPAPVAICWHGHGTEAKTWGTNANYLAISNALAAAGFIVVSASYASSTTTWGADESLDAYYSAYEYVRDRYSIGAVVFVANSMGSIESLVELSKNRIPGVVAWVGTSPTFDLANNYANAAFTSAINTAYGITGTSPNTYAQKTAGHDPALLPATAFRGLPMKVWHATDDTTVTKAANGDALIAAVADTSPDASIVATTGGHSFTITSYLPDIVAFLKKYA